MITIYNNEDVQQLHDPELRELVQGHLITAKENGLENLTCIAVIEPADSEETIFDGLGFSPLQSHLTETRFGDPGFSPAWDWLEVHSCGWCELIFTVGNDGFAYLIFTDRRSGPGWLADVLAAEGGRSRNLKTCHAGHTDSGKNPDDHSGDR